ncbi:25_t:CDS:2 [Rhizophagus irregularis]|nr:25_t:CDS:2 [Rhizophagus irregularis]
MTTILSLKSELVKWPIGELRRIVHLGLNNIGGFNNIIGIDDIHIILETAPFEQPEIYWNRWDYLLGDSAYLLSIFLIKPLIILKIT